MHTIERFDAKEPSMMVELLIPVGLASLGFFAVAMGERSRRLCNEEEKRALNRQLVIQGEYLRQMEMQIDEGRRLRHDYRQHTRVISELAAGGNIEEIKHYVQSADQMYMTTDGGRLTANAELDALLQHYRRCVADTSIDFKTKLELPKHIGIPSADMGIVLGNLLENAVDAALECEKAAAHRSPSGASCTSAGNPYVFVGGHARAGMLVLAIDNTYAGDVWEAGGRFASTKHKGPGLGISSAQQIVESHGGVFSITHDAGIFRVSIGIPFA